MGRRQLRAKNGGGGLWGKGKREGAVECLRGVKDGVQGPSPGSNCSSSGSARGWGHRLGRGPTFCPRHSSPSQESRASQSKARLGRSWTGIGAGPLRSWTPPLCVPPHKAGRDRGRSQASRARPAPAVSRARKPSHSAAAGVGRGPRACPQGRAPPPGASSGPRPSWDSAAARSYKARPFGPRRAGGGALDLGACPRGRASPLTYAPTLQFWAAESPHKAAPIRAGRDGVRVFGPAP